MLCRRGYCLDPANLDLVPPELAEAPSVSPQRGRAGTRFTIDLVSTQALADPPEITLRLEPAVRLTCGQGSDALRFSCDYTATGNENAGLGGQVDFDVRLVDISGNETVVPFAGVLRLDFTPPTLASTHVVPEVARFGATISIFFTVSEALMGPAVLTSSERLDEGDGGTGNTFSLQPDGATLNYRFTHLVTAADPKGDVSFTVSLTDLAGNTATALRVGKSQVDGSLPAVLNAVVTPSRAKAGTLVTTTFEASKPFGAAPTINLGGIAMTRDPTVMAPQYRYTHTAQAVDGEGLKQVVLSGVDLAGNTLVDTLGLTTFDFTAPTLAARSVSPTVARLGTMLDVFAGASEPLAGPALVKSSVGLDDGDGGFADAFSLAPEGASSNYRLTHVVTAADPVEQVSFTISMTDLAGNASSDVPIGSSLIDGTLPQVLNAAVFPARAKAGTQVVATFSVSEALVAPPNVTVGNVAMARDVTVMPPQYRYTHLAQPGDGAGLKTVSVAATDVSGNDIQDNLGAVIFDFTPPGIAFANVTYTPAPSNLLSVVTKATVGTTITVSVVADESLSSAVPRLSASFGNSTLDFCLVGVDCPSDTRPSSLTEFGATFEGVVPASAVDGAYVPTLTWTDVVGNSGSRSFAAPPILVKTFIPTLVLNGSQVTFRRSPYGNGAVETVGAFSIPAGPYFALAPPSPLDNLPTLPATAVSFGATRPVRVRAWPGAAKTGLLGTMAPNADSSWPRLTLSDVPSVYLSGVDEAGNESANVQVPSVEWVATVNPPAMGMNPHRLDLTTRVQGSVTQNTSFTTAAGAGAGAADATAVIARAEAAWRSRVPSVVTPSQRTGLAMAYDSARGRVVLFSGFSGGGNPNDTWEWDGTVWANKTPASGSPASRSYHAMAYDSRRGRVVMFGGYGLGGLFYQDIWEWDGTVWVDKTPTGTKPTGRIEHGLVYDSARGRIVMFGGSVISPALQDTWEWDGTSWTDKTPAGTKPPARRGWAMAYDSARQRSVLAGGGLQETWEWDGATWANVSPAGTKPPARSYPAMAYDSARGRVMMFAGAAGSSLQDIWEWDGITWVNKTPVGLKPSARTEFAMAYDSARGRALTFGGPVADTWEWNGTSWFNRTPSAAAPPARRGHAMAYDPVRKQVVMFGGFTSALAQDVWEWDGSAWANKTPAGTKPAARDGHAMTYDTARARVVLFGGDNGSARLQDMWEWDGTVWLDKTPAGTKPSLRSAHALVNDSARSRVVLFGGTDGTSTLQDVWEWDGAAWLDKTPAGTKPAARSGHAMAFDVARARAVLFGGNTGATRLQDAWEWDGTAWVDKTPVGTKPGVREGHSMTYDAARARVVLFGGDNGTAKLQDQWEWDGTSWVNKTPAGTKPPMRSLSAMVFDNTLERTWLFGGLNAAGASNGELWELDASAGRQPAITFVATGNGWGALPVLDVTVRAHCAGNFSPFTVGSTGATLYGWVTGGAATEPGTWQPVASNTAGLNAAQPWLPAPNAALMSWSAGSTAEAQRYIRSRDSSVAFQCRPSGSAGVNAQDARVALDYIELRVRHGAP